MLCVAVLPFSGHSHVRPGHVASYAIWVWSARAQSHDVRVTAKVAKARGAGPARFTVCPNLSESVCDLGNLPAGQPDELQATVKVGNSAKAGEKMQLTAEVRASDAAASHGSAKVLVTASPSPSPAPTTPTTGPPAEGSLPPPPSLPALPTSSGDGSLFPTVTPGSTAAASPQPTSSAPTGRHSLHATTDAATLPLDSRLIGGQLLGLAVLAGAIAMAIARLSLRTSRPGRRQEHRELSQPRQRSGAEAAVHNPQTLPKRTCPAPASYQARLKPEQPGLSRPANRCRPGTPARGRPGRPARCDSTARPA